MNRNKLTSLLLPVVVAFVCSSAASAQELPRVSDIENLEELSRNYMFTAFSDTDGNVAIQLMLDLSFRGNIESDAGGAIEWIQPNGDQAPIKIGEWRLYNAEILLVKLDLPGEDGFPSSTISAWGLVQVTFDEHFAIRGGWRRPRPSGSGFFNAVSSTPAR